MSAQPCGVDEHGDPNVYGPNRHSVTYRYGYKVAGCEARYVGHESDEKAASSLAKTTAETAQRMLREIGGPTDVEWWIQKRTTTTEVTHDEPQGYTT